MKSKPAVVFLSLLALGICARVMAASPPSTPLGYWKTFDDKTGKPRSIVLIRQIDGELRGRIEKLIEPQKSGPICDKCSGDQKNKPILGLEFLGGFKREGEGWSDGWVLDPENGSTYHANLEVVDDGKRLKLFGYVRVLFKIGRSQTWERISPEEWGITPEE